MTGVQGPLLLVAVLFLLPSRDRRERSAYFAAQEKFAASSVLPDPEYFATIG